ncbi:PAS domain-containing protein [Niabella hibiscisoli]|nr:PAS domain-containing protein [Niabella hibiscisoli]MCH5717060.1 PAS domain S-box protein [Niabella hibiscisoli]
MVTNRNGRIINFNKQAEKDFGYAKDEIIQKPLEILLPQR